jgi:hypothetical protein
MFRREYHFPSGRIYLIFTKNTEKRGEVDFGIFKHSEAASWSVEIDYGTQASDGTLAGCVFNPTHRFTSGKGGGDYRCGVLSSGRNMLQSADGKMIIATKFSAYLHNTT